MNKARQTKLDIARTQTETVLEFLSGSILLFLIILLFQNWNAIPDLIPTHFGISGKADAWESKYAILLLPSITLLIYVGLTILGRYPHVYNYPWRITDENATRQYILARTFLCWLKFELVVLFTCIEWITIQVALGKSSGLGIEFLPFFMTIVFGTIGIYFWLAYKAR
jgi:uncharacterized membrane protein